MEEGLNITLKENILFQIKKISYFNQKIQLLQCQNLLLKIEFMQISLYYISGLNQDSKNFFQFWVCFKIVFQQQTSNL